MRVLIIDDHALFRVGLQELLERRGIEIAGAVGDGAEGVRMARELNPDVVLLDLRMPGMGGVEVLKRLRAEGLRMPIAMLTTSREEPDLVQSLREGAQAYLVKDMEPEALVDALGRIVAGGTVVAPEMAAVLARMVRTGGKAEPPQPTPFSVLTRREKEILCLLAEGGSNKVIGRRLGISDGTVKLHVKSILRKLAVHSRVEAAVMAVEHGLCVRQGEG